MKVEQNINHDAKGFEVFGITPERVRQIKDFLHDLVPEISAEKGRKAKRSEVIVKIVEFAENPIEAVVIYGYLEDCRKQTAEIVNTLGKVIGAALSGAGRNPNIKTGQIDIKDGEIVGISGDEIPDEMIEDFTKLADQLKAFKPTGNMKVDENGNIKS